MKVNEYKRNRMYELVGSFLRGWPFEDYDFGDWEEDDPDRNSDMKALVKDIVDFCEKLYEKIEKRCLSDGGDERKEELKASESYMSDG